MTEPTPKALGYRMPAEWEPHQATWVSWPHKEASWPGKLNAILSVFARMVAEISCCETVHINVNDSAMENLARSLLQQHVPLGEVVFHHFPTNDAWCRDHGAVFLTHRANDQSSVPLLAIDWQYNAWGEKYPPYDLDNQIPRRMAEFLDVPCVSMPMVLEGGSIDVNGAGTLLTTESCLLNRNRNPDRTREEIETALRDFLGVEQVVWLGDGIAGDDTDGHIDDLTRFVGHSTVVTVVEPDPADVNYEPLQANLERLRSMRINGEPLKIIELPMPPAIIHENQRLPASYANFYIANDRVLLPTFNATTDGTALHVLQSVFPHREIVGIDCTDLIWGLGAFHCLTQQVPAVG